MSRGGGRGRGAARRECVGWSYPPNPQPILEARNAPGVSLVTQFQAGHGWGLLGGTTGNVNDSAAGHVVGTQCAWWSGNGNNTATGMRRAGGPSFDLTDKDIGILLRVDEPNQLTPGGGVSFIFYAGNGTFTNYLTFDLTSAASIKYFPRRSTSGTAFGGSWVYITIPTDTTTNSWTAKVGTQTVPQILANVTDWQFLARDPNPSTPSRTSVQEIFLVPKQSTYPNGVCCLTFDDGFQSTYTKVAPIVQAVGGRATAYIIKNQVDTANFLTLAQMKDLQNTYGWAVGSHSYLGIDHEAGGGIGFTDLTADACTNDIQQLRQWLRSQGMNAYDHLAYPHGAYCIEANGDGNINDRVDVTLAPYLKTARTLYGKMPETIPLADRMKMRVWTATGGSTTLATLQTQADVAKRCKSAMVIVFHEIVDTGPPGSSQWLTADLSSLVTYIDSIGMPLRTIDEVFT
jgi:peptidoglycan/xylan/chitin deacetylase (PgdA/CDA1 family)